MTKAEKEGQRLVKIYETNLEQVKNESETNIHLAKQEKEQALSKVERSCLLQHPLSDETVYHFDLFLMLVFTFASFCQASDAITKLENQIKESQRTLKDTELQQQKAIERLTLSHRQEKADLENKLTKKVLHFLFFPSSLEPRIFQYFWYKPLV